MRDPVLEKGSRAGSPPRAYATDFCMTKGVAIQRHAAVT